MATEPARAGESSGPAPKGVKGWDGAEPTYPDRAGSAHLAAGP